MIKKGETLQTWEKKGGWGCWLSFIYIWCETNKKKTSAIENTQK